MVIAQPQDNLRRDRTSPHKHVDPRLFKKVGDLVLRQVSSSELGISCFR